MESDIIRILEKKNLFFRGMNPNETDFTPEIETLFLIEFWKKMTKFLIGQKGDIYIIDFDQVQS